MIAPFDIPIRFDLDAMLAQINAENRHEETSTGGPVGAELLAED